MKKLFLIFTAMLFLSSCADMINIESCVIDNPYGFFGGLWHGLITPFSFIGSIFFDNITVYAINNNGGWYEFGFLLGIG